MVDGFNHFVVGSVVNPLSELVSLAFQLKLRFALGAEEVCDGVVIPEGLEVVGAAGGAKHFLGKPVLG